MLLCWICGRRRARWALCRVGRWVGRGRRGSRVGRCWRVGHDVTTPLLVRGSVISNVTSAGANIETTQLATGGLIRDPLNRGWPATSAVRGPDQVVVVIAPRLHGAARLDLCFGAQPPGVGTAGAEVDCVRVRHRRVFGRGAGPSILPNERAIQLRVRISSEFVPAPRLEHEAFTVPRPGPGVAAASDLVQRFGRGAKVRLRLSSAYRTGRRPRYKIGEVIAATARHLVAPHAIRVGHGISSQPALRAAGCKRGLGGRATVDPIVVCE